MKKVLPFVGALAAALMSASGAQATQTIVITGPSGTFGNDDVTCPGGAAPCSFTNVFNFMTPMGFNLASATISSIETANPATALDFSSVTLNGVEFTNAVSDGSEFRNLFNQALVQGADNTIRVAGTSGGNASFAGTLSFAAVSAVPEPATWAMMLIGFGAVGYSMRRRGADVRMSSAF